MSAPLRRERPPSKRVVHFAPNTRANPLIDKEGGRLSRRGAHVKIVRGDFDLHAAAPGAPRRLTPSLVGFRAACSRDMTSCDLPRSGWCLAASTLYPALIMARPRACTHKSTSTSATDAQCPLYPQKQTLDLSRVMSALCQKQTFCTAVRNVVIRSPRRRGRAAMAERQGRAPWRSSG
jgi:hypothetical protein